MVRTGVGASAATGARVASALAVLAAAVAAGVSLGVGPLADAFFAATVLGIVSLVVVAAVGAWTTRPTVAWFGALAVAAVVVVGRWSAGVFIVPAALALLAAAATSQRARRRERDRDGPDDSPAWPVLVGRALAGAAALAVGATLLYLGAFVRELFAAGCARETLSCALAVTNWDAVALTALGVLAVAVGGSLVWKQAFRASLAAWGRRGSNDD
ncbi:hypothetical protein [Halorubellus litoreus]|uniref:Uncharacterized protein n=1 Tax=Halorubellus litoreus TaxID=755308 RepID=A0ABD5VDV0_9EURY